METDKYFVKTFYFKVLPNEMISQALRFDFAKAPIEVDGRYGDLQVFFRFSICDVSISRKVMDF